MNSNNFQIIATVFINASTELIKSLGMYCDPVVFLLLLTPLSLSLFSFSLSDSENFYFRKKLLIASLLCIIFMVVEIVGEFHISSFSLFAEKLTSQCFSTGTFQARMNINDSFFLARPFQTFSILGKYRFLLARRKVYKFSFTSSK